LHGKLTRYGVVTSSAVTSAHRPNCDELTNCPVADPARPPPVDDAVRKVCVVDQSLLFVQVVADFIAASRTVAPLVYSALDCRHCRVVEVGIR
jgi:hypothetical protein